MNTQPSFWTSAPGIAAIGLIGCASYFLLMEHREHLFEFLPYLILLLCPLMHLFMHRSHGHHHSEQADDDVTDNHGKTGTSQGDQDAR